MLGADGGDEPGGAPSSARNAYERTRRETFYVLGPEDLLARRQEARATRPGPDRHLPLASRLRRVLLRNRSGELLPLVFVRRALGEERAIRPRQQLPVRRRQTDRRERRIDLLTWPKYLIPTPLRQFAGQAGHAWKSPAPPWAKCCTALTSAVPRPAQAAVQRRRQAAQLRQRLRERRRHPLPGKGRDAGEGRRHDLDRAEHRRRVAGRCRDGGARSTKTRSCATAAT